MSEPSTQLRGLSWGPAFIMSTGRMGRLQCPAGDGGVLPGQWAKGASNGRVWHDDCAEDAGAYKPA